MNNPEEDKIIYCIVDAAGKYYNAEKKYYANLLYLGTFYSTAQNAHSFITGHDLKAQVQETNYNDFAESIATFTTKATIQAESLIANFRQIKYSLPTVRRLNHKLDNSLEKTIKLMKMFNPMFQEFLNKKEDNTYDVTGYYEEFVEEVASVELYHCSDITKIIQAYKKDKASVMGISNKILR